MQTFLKCFFQFLFANCVFVERQMAPGAQKQVKREREDAVSERKDASASTDIAATSSAPVAATAAAAAGLSRRPVAAVPPGARSVSPVEHICAYDDLGAARDRAAFVDEAGSVGLREAEDGPRLRLDSVRVERARVFRRQVEGCASALKVVVQIHEECESRSHRAAVRVVHVPAVCADAGAGPRPVDVWPVYSALAVGKASPARVDTFERVLSEALRQVPAHPLPDGLE
mmetsp:Transcript_15462/g.32961  ORF Transcript_15462/g.32961 Transcript_15462/m.32961 type:complete len:229 (-) Transcript_15462:1252-1938(-)